MKKELLRTLKYALVAVSAGLIQISSFALFNEVLRLSAWLSYLTALVLSVLWNFTINRRYTFKSASNVPRAMAMVFAYYLVFTPLSTWLERYLTVGAGWNEYLVTGINMLLNFTTEFLFQRFIVFRNTLDTNDLAAGSREELSEKNSEDPS